MMLYHLGLATERTGGGKRLRPLLSTLLFEALAGAARPALPAAAAAGAAALASDDRSVRELLGQFGQAFGQAFQAHDDLLGIWASTERTGKVELNDLIKRKKTLPVVLAFERASPNVRVGLAG